MENKGFIRIGNIIFRIDEIKAISMSLETSEYDPETGRETLIYPKIRINKHIVVEYGNNDDMIADYEKISDILCGEKYENMEGKFYRKTEIFNTAK